MRLQLEQIVKQKLENKNKKEHNKTCNFDEMRDDREEGPLTKRKIKFSDETLILSPNTAMGL